MPMEPNGILTTPLPSAYIKHTDHTVFSKLRHTNKYKEFQRNVVKSRQNG